MELFLFMEEYRVPKEKLRIVYGEILRGCSSVFIESFGKMEVKHLTIFDTELIDEEREKHSERARKKGLPTREEKLQELEKEGSWTKKQEKELAELEDFIS